VVPACAASLCEATQGAMAGGSSPRDFCPRNASDADVTPRPSVSISGMPTLCHITTFRSDGPPGPELWRNTPIPNPCRRLRTRVITERLAAAPRKCFSEPAIGFPVIPGKKQNGFESEIPHPPRPPNQPSTIRAASTARFLRQAGPAKRGLFGIIQANSEQSAP